VARGLPAGRRDRAGRGELRRAGIGQSCRCSGDQRGRDRFDRFFHAHAQREPDCLAITDEQRNAHPSADGHIHEHPVTYRVANSHRYANGDAWPHT